MRNTRSTPIKKRCWKYQSLQKLVTVANVLCTTYCFCTHWGKMSTILPPGPHQSHFWTRSRCCQASPLNVIRRFMCTAASKLQQSLSVFQGVFTGLVFMPDCRSKPDRVLVHARSGWTILFWGWWRSGTAYVTPVTVRCRTTFYFCLCPTRSGETIKMSYPGLVKLWPVTVGSHFLIGFVLYPLHCSV